MIRRTHLVHPGTTVVLVASEAESCLFVITFDLDVETLVFHMSIYLFSSIPFSEFDALGMSVYDLNYDFSNRVFWRPLLNKLRSLYVFFLVIVIPLRLNNGV